LRVARRRVSQQIDGMHIAYSGTIKAAPLCGGPNHCALLTVVPILQRQTALNSGRMMMRYKRSERITASGNSKQSLIRLNINEIS
jgi:hypothetical protein